MEDRAAIENCGMKLVDHFGSGDSGWCEIFEPAFVMAIDHHTMRLGAKIRPLAGGHEKSEVLMPTRGLHRAARRRVARPAIVACLLQGDFIVAGDVP